MTEASTEVICKRIGFLNLTLTFLFHILTGLKLQQSDWPGS